MTKCFFKSMFIYKNVQYNEMTSKNWMRKYSQDKKMIPEHHFIVTCGPMSILGFGKNKRQLLLFHCFVTDFFVFPKILSTLCLLGNFACFCRLLIIFKNQLFEKFFQEYHKTVGS